ncbi:CRISPR-associated protein Cas5 [Sulfobacillus acidophilus TPY]|uniref:CRISPR-associated protein Cas5 n=1 Tax=Sulfobacillus acidophilus (strain ATCC 700253 / DSM 10332 / NAL) TaxID=679936 RepID=G8TT46_SULAD|nr:CRISPR-associated protein Cas5 [Sulfobacillus acidophilus TPY]AEW06746.1 CRISPR-associated protein Cas5 [Sulfobacillus acidophilus DSM 10332]
MDVMVFELRGPLAHFRRPDTTSTHATYPFITRTALRGLLAAILGRETWPEDSWTGVSLVHPVQTRVQQLSMLGKGFLESGPMFNRPTAVEMVVNPHYRIYYSGPLIDELATWVSQGRSTYPTYLGSAFALTYPEWEGRYQLREWGAEGLVPKPLVTVIPVHAVTEIEPEPGVSFARVGGVLYQALDGRRFRGTMAFIYERNLRPYRVKVAHQVHPAVRFVYTPDETGLIALW